MEALTEEEIIELTDTNTFAKKKSDQFIRAQEVAIFLEMEAGPNLCRLQRAYAAGYRMKEAEPLPPSSRSPRPAKEWLARLQSARPSPTPTEPLSPSREKWALPRRPTLITSPTPPRRSPQ